MGKRELLIIVAFICLGGIAYHLTAPPPKPGEKRFSWSGLTGAWRQQSGRRAQATTTTVGSVPVAATVGELSISGAVTVVVTGEPRADVAWSLRVDATGRDDAAARAAASAVTISHDDLGGVLALAVHTPRGGPQTATLTVRTPARLAVRADAPMRTTIDGVAAARLDNASGDADVHDIAGAVTGTHHNGTLTIARAGSVALTLVGTTLTLTDARRDAAVNLRNGSVTLANVAGPLTVDTSNALVDVTEPAGVLRATLSGGSITISHPRADVRVDARGARVIADMDRAVPITAMTTGGAIQLVLGAHVPIALDAVANGGTITATDAGLAADHDAHGATLRASLGGATRVALRSDGGEIVITRSK